MAEFGVTSKGFVLKRLDTILEEIHSDLSEGFSGSLKEKIDTRQNPQSLLNVLITTYAGQIADLWEVAQNSYYAKYPATAEGVNLDNAVQYGGVWRAASRPTFYSLHCTGDDGTVIRKGTVVASSTKPQVRLSAVSGFQISRDNFNKVKVRIVALEPEQIYTVSINGTQYSYVFKDNDSELSVIHGICEAITDTAYSVIVDADNKFLVIEDKNLSRNNILVLSENLTTTGVTTIASFVSEDVGKIVLMNGTVTEIITGINGFDSVINLLEPMYGRRQETDVELRQSYIAKSSLRSSRMIASITSKLLNDIENVESATGYENETDLTDAEGRPPHSIELVVEGGNEIDIAKAILDKKAGGIQTFGSVEVPITTEKGDALTIRFNRPEYVYAWLKVTLYGKASQLPSNYKNLVIDSILKDTAGMIAGDSLLCQMLHEGIYNTVRGVTYIKIEAAYTSASSEIPVDYLEGNIEVTSRQKVVLSDTRIKVLFGEGGN